MHPKTTKHHPRPTRHNRTTPRTPFHRHRGTAQRPDTAPRVPGPGTGSRPRHLVKALAVFDLRRTTTAPGTNACAGSGSRS
eukprot:5363201-Prymnesium_polylepis.1